MDLHIQGLASDQKVEIYAGRSPLNKTAPLKFDFEVGRQNPLQVLEEIVQHIRKTAQVDPNEFQDYQEGHSVVYHKIIDWQTFPEESHKLKEQNRKRAEDIMLALMDYKKELK